MNDKEKPIPIMRANCRELDYILKLTASRNEMLGIKENMYKRVKAVPGGWRDLSMMITVLSKLIENLKMTLPEEKREGIKLLQNHMQYNLHCNGTVTNGGEGTIMYFKDVDVLLKAAHDGQCKICMKDTCKGCKLAKTFDRISTYDRDGAPWSTIDFEGDLSE